jgi:hypothetical protein
MKTLARLALLLILPLAAHADLEQIQITARYEGFDPARFPELKLNVKDPAVLSSPSVTTKSGNRAIIEIIRENAVPEPGNGEKTVNTGVSLDVTPLVKDGQIHLSGKSTVRSRLTIKNPQPLAATTFESRETYFNGLIEGGAELTLQVGDGKQDKARIILTARLVNAQGQPPR